MYRSIISASTAFLLAAFAAGAATLNGTVRVATNNGGTGAAIADAKVVLYGFGGGGGGVQTPLDTATTNAQGQYSFTGVTPGFRQVVASKAGYQNGQAFANVTQNNETYTANITMAVTGGGGDNTGWVVGFIRSGSAQGPAIANATVILSRTGPGGTSFRDSLVTPATGWYRFEKVPALNNYTVTVRAVGYNSATNSNVDVDEGDSTVANFNLTPVPGPAKPGSIAGSVRRASDNAVIGGATVVISRNGSRVDSGKTDPEGHYAFDSVAANTNYTITVSATGYQSAVNSDVDVTVNQTTTVDFRLLGSGPVGTRGNIIGTVVDVNRKGVAKARIILSRAGTLGGSGPIDTVESDASGDFAFDSVAALQNYTLTVTATGYQTAVNNNVDVVAGQAVVADFILVTSTGLLSGPHAGASFRLLGGRGALAVEFPSSPWAGRLSAYDARGALAYSGSVPAGTARMSLPSKTSIRFLVLERGGMVEKLQVAPLR